MTKLGPYEVHPFAAAFPLVEGDEFTELAMDVKKNGLREPILLNHDRTVLIDGRNRFRACEAAGVDAVFETLGPHYDEPKILDLIVSKNLARRHLNPGQRAMVALKYEEAIRATVRRGRPLGDSARSTTTERTEIEADLPHIREPQVRDRAAKVVGASGRAVQQAKAVERDAPDLAEKVRAGEIALDAADKQRRARIAAMPKPEPAPSDRKSTRLNSSHVKISYAVFCLKKKKS